MYKYILYNDEFKVKDTIEGILSFSYTIDSLSYDTENGSHGTIGGIQEIFIVTDEDTNIDEITKIDVMDFLKQAKINELSEECEIHIRGGFFYNGDLFAFDDKDQTNFTQQVSLMALDLTVDSVKWKTENNGEKVFTRDEFIKIVRASAEHKNKCIDKYRALQKIILESTYESLDELRAITFAEELNTEEQEEPVA